MGKITKDKQPEAPAKTPQEQERELDEAVERIYQRYGNDVAAFHRDVEREQLLKRAER